MSICHSLQRCFHFVFFPPFRGKPWAWHDKWRLWITRRCPPLLGTLPPDMQVATDVAVFFPESVWFNVVLKEVKSHRISWHSGTYEGTRKHKNQGDPFKMNRQTAAPSLFLRDFVCRTTLKRRPGVRRPGPASSPDLAPSVRLWSSLGFVLST